jgi:hypothetical protein
VYSDNIVHRQPGDMSTMTALEAGYQPLVQTWVASEREQEEAHSTDDQAGLADRSSFTRVLVGLKPGVLREFSADSGQRVCRCNHCSETVCLLVVLLPSSCCQHRGCRVQDACQDACGQTKLKLQSGMQSAESAVPLLPAWTQREQTWSRHWEPSAAAGSRPCRNCGGVHLWQPHTVVYQPGRRSR